MRRYANKRDANEPEIVRALEAIGCDVLRQDTPCDLLVGYRARNYLIEVKQPGRENRRDQQEQAEWRKHWRGQVRVVTTAEEAIELVTESYEQA